MDAIFAVRVATWHSPNAVDEMTALGITPAAVLEMLANGSHRGWLCEVNGQAVGFAMGNRNTGEMWVIAVLKAYEGLGIGRHLLAQVEAWLWAAGWEEIWLTTDPDETVRAVGFYRHSGWRDWKLDQNRYLKKRRPAGRHP
ncbi:MAG: GNAT family N-acetyltransferase [Desulfosarcinaceae bacterium]|nr:GNAT family N-acetyltransferase [Desulfosarcinaceae bacterium]